VIDHPHTEWSDRDHITVLLVGTCDTKSAELEYLRQCVSAHEASALIMDVGVLAGPPIHVDFTRHDVASAAQTTNAAIVALGDENASMAKTAEGAAALAATLANEGRIDAVVILGGTMGTDLALDVAAALPFGLPKVILSTVAFSPLIPADRVAPDLIMVLWAGGLYGLNAMSRTSLRNAVGAAVGGSRLRVDDGPQRPLVAISSLGTSALRYVIELVPALEARGFEPAVFHTTGMGGRALAHLAQQGRFVAIFDFCLQEVMNQLFGSQVGSGEDRLAAPGIPRLIAPGGVDMIDAVAFQPIPDAIAGHEFHQHNRLITSAMASLPERRHAAEHIAAQLAKSDAPTVFLLPRGGVSEWDRPGGPLHDRDAIDGMAAAFATAIKPPVELVDLDTHLNDPLFAKTAIDIFDQWIVDGVVPAPKGS
jgi:uncharacterized protein (UPF0261 family)